MVLPQGHRGNQSVMAAPQEQSASASSASSGGNIHRRLQNGYYLLEGTASLGTNYYFNYLFFYMEKHFGFGNRDNLLISALYGLAYMCGSSFAGPFGLKRGYFFALKLSFAGMALMMAAGGLAPMLFGYSHTTMILEWVIVALWTPIMCLCWPTFQALLSREQSPGEGSRTAGIYNLMWSGTAAAAYLTSGVLLDTFGGEVLFWLPAGLHLCCLAMLPKFQKLEAQARAQEKIPAASAEELPRLNPRPISKAKSFLWLGWIANPFSYVGVYSVIPVIPKLAEKFNLSATQASVVCSVWLWVRLAGFFLFWRWTGWHYRFRVLLAAFVGMIATYLCIMLSPTVWALVAAQIVFGLCVSLIYYSSLFYSMDAGASKGKRGGFHEAAIGLGIFIGPGTGVAALHAFPNVPHAGVWAMSALLVLGLGLFLYVRNKELRMSKPG
jgi:predicted MFS family arabinose efflux permease